MKKLLLALLLILGSLAALLLWMAGGLPAPGERRSPAETIRGVPRARSSTAAGELSVLVWNIAWGYGWKSEGNGPARPAQHFAASLPKLAATIRLLDPDLVLLQEIDFDSRRSHHVDQLRALAEGTGLLHVARAVSWDASWVPFPYWPPSQQFGSMQSGGAILSRYPIQSHTVELLEKPAENPFWYNLFYLFRYLQRVEIEWEGQRVFVVNCHLEAFKTENRLRQARLAAERMAALAHGGRIIFGGDLNAVPSEARQKSGYPDEEGGNKTSHEGDGTVGFLRAVPGLTDSVDKERYLTDEAAWATFPSHAPNRMLDHLFFGDAFTLVEVRVPRAEAGTTSDHLPLFVRLRRR